MSTAELSRDLRRDVEHYRGLWRTAKTADAKVPTSVSSRSSIVDQLDPAVDHPDPAIDHPDRAADDLDHLQ